MMKRILVILFVLAAMLAGCWDKVELDRRALVLGAAMDTVPQSDEFKSKGHVKEDGRELYILTVETHMAKMASVTSGEGGGNGGGEGNGGVQQRAKRLMMHTGTSFFEALRKMATESDKILFFGHQQVLIIGEELARTYDLNKIMDFWDRDPEIDRSLKVLIAKGRAGDIFNADPKHSQAVSTFIRNQSEQTGKTSRFINLGLVEFLSKLEKGADLLVGGIALLDDEGLKISGSAVIKGGRLQGWLDEMETMAAQFVMDEVKGGEIVAPDPERKGNFITAEIFSAKSRLNAEIQDGMPSFAVDVKMECGIVEISDQSVKSVEEKKIAVAEKAVSAAVEKQIKDTVTKLQKQYKADVLGFGDKFEKYHNREWKEIKEKWDKLYPEVPVYVKVQTKVRKVGRKY